jgi:hypothetical protein
MFMPGGFYKFSNAATENATFPVFGITGKVGIVF